MKESKRRRLSPPRIIFILEDVASETKGVLLGLAENHTDKDTRHKLVSAADWFDRLANIQKCRADIYSSELKFKRINHLLKILQGGGYWGKPFVTV